MELWDNITQKAAAVTEKAVQRAKNLAEQAKLRNQIAEAERTVTDCYTQIGKQYAAAHPENFEECYAPMMAAIAGAQRQIASLQEQLRELKAVSLCPKCGAEVSKDAAFCSACGAEMPKPAPVEAEVVTDDAPVEKSPTEEAPAQEAPAEEAPTEQPPVEAAPAEEAPAEDSVKAAPAEDAPKADAPEYI